MTTDVAAAAVDPRIGLAWSVLNGVLDSEVPVVSVVELGIVRDVRLDDSGLTVVLTPTYSGCPATELIESEVRSALTEAGCAPVAIVRQRAPAWTSDWITADGRRKLRDYGIVPPASADLSQGVAMRFMLRRAAEVLACPRCDSPQTERLAAFGSTACKALYRCIACGEPFEYFKPI